MTTAVTGAITKSNLHPYNITLQFKLNKLKTIINLINKLINKLINTNKLIPQLFLLPKDNC